MPRDVVITRLLAEKETGVEEEVIYRSTDTLHPLLEPQAA